MLWVREIRERLCSGFMRFVRGCVFVVVFRWFLMIFDKNFGYDKILIQESENTRPKAKKDENIIILYDGKEKIFTVFIGYFSGPKNTLEQSSGLEHMPPFLFSYPYVPIWIILHFHRLFPHIFDPLPCSFRHRNVSSTLDSLFELICAKKIRGKEKETKKMKFLVTISMLHLLAGTSILHQTPWTSSREVSCSWDDRGFLVDGKPFVFTKEEIASSRQIRPTTRSRNNRMRSIHTKDADNDDDDDEIIDDAQGDGSDAASKTDDEVITTGDEPQVTTVDGDTHSSSTNDDDDDDGADDDNNDDKEDDEDADVDIVSTVGKGGFKSQSKPPKPSTSRVHNNAAAIAEVKAIWRDVIRGAREGSTIASSSTVLSVVPGSGEGETSTPTQLSTVSVHIKSSSVADDPSDDAAVALRANGTDRASFLRQVCPLVSPNGYHLLSQPTQRLLTYPYSLMSDGGTVSQSAGHHYHRHVKQCHCQQQ